MGLQQQLSKVVTQANLRDLPLKNPPFCCPVVLKVAVLAAYGAASRSTQQAGGVKLQHVHPQRWKHGGDDGGSTGMAASLCLAYLKWAAQRSPVTT